MLHESVNLIQTSKQIVFMTGAGVSTPSGIPDYRSMTGVYHGIDEPEYLLSHSCLMNEPETFYDFVKQLYHENAEPNGIHLKIKELEKKHKVTIITQNIDCLHDKAGSRNVISFHGNLYDCYCMKCQKKVSVSEYLCSDKHKHCSGQIRPNIVLYEENLSERVIEAAIDSIQKADLIVIVGTSFKVYPFSGLINYRHQSCKLMVVNNECIDLDSPHIQIQDNAENFFDKL